MAKTGARRGQKRQTSLTPPPDLAAAPGFEVRRLYQAYQLAWTRHVDSTLTGPQFAVLSAARAYPERDQASLASAVSLDTSTMADVCRRLEQRGLIARSDSKVDGRAKVLALTAEGESMFDAITLRARALDRQLLDAFPHAERPDVVDLLERLGTHWESTARREPAP